LKGRIQRQEKGRGAPKKEKKNWTLAEAGDRDFVEAFVGAKGMKIFM